MPYKRDEVERLVGKVDGVSMVVNQIDVTTWQLLTDKANQEN